MDDINDSITQLILGQCLTLLVTLSKYDGEEKLFLSCYFIDRTKINDNDAFEQLIP